MRVVAFILSIFILTLSFVPCSDNVCEEKESIDLTSSHDDHDHEDDSCTPFCACSCCGCGGFVLSAPVFFQTTEEVVTIIKTVTIYHSDFISSYYYSFWQPPKLG